MKKTLIALAIVFVVIYVGQDVLTALLGLVDSSVCSAFEQAIGACL